MSFVETIQQNIGLVSYSIYIFILIAVCLFYGMRNRGKKAIRVQTPDGERVVWKKVEPDGCTVVMRKRNKKDMGWKFTFTNLSKITKKKWFGLNTFETIEVYQDANTAIEKNFSTKTELQPTWDKKTSKGLIEAEILRHAGKEPEGKTSMAIWVIALLVVANIVITLVASGRIRIG